MGGVASKPIYRSHTVHTSCGNIESFRFPIYQRLRLCTYVQVDLLVPAFVDEVFLQDFSGLFLRRPLRVTTYTNDPVSSKLSPRIDGCLYFLSNRLAFVNFVIVIISEFSMYKGSLRKICTDRMLLQ